MLRGLFSGEMVFEAEVVDTGSLTIMACHDRKR